jgi:hypothetical protein
MRAAFPTLLILPDLITVVVFGEVYRLWGDGEIWNT